MEIRSRYASGSTCDARPNGRGQRSIEDYRESGSEDRVPEPERPARASSNIDGYERPKWGTTELESHVVFRRDDHPRARTVHRRRRPHRERFRIRTGTDDRNDLVSRVCRDTNEHDSGSVLGSRLPVLGAGVHVSRTLGRTVGPHGILVARRGPRIDRSSTDSTEFRHSGNQRDRTGRYHPSLQVPGSVRASTTGVGCGNRTRAVGRRR